MHVGYMMVHSNGTGSIGMSRSNQALGLGLGQSLREEDGSPATSLKGTLNMNQSEALDAYRYKTTYNIP